MAENAYKKKKINKDTKVLNKMTDEILEETPESTETPTPEGGEVEKPKESKDLQSAIAQKEHWREKAEKAEKELQDLKGKTVEQPQAKPQAVETTNPMEVVKISKILNKYSDEESEYLISRAGGMSYDAIKKAEEDPWTKVAIEGMREKVEKDNSILEPSGVSKGGFKDKTDEEIANMTKPQMEAYAKDFMKHQTGKSGV